MTPVNLRLICCAAIRLVILSSSVLPLKFIQYNKDLRNWLFKSHLYLLAICTHFEIKEIINFGWSVMWVLMIQNFQVYLNCTYNVLYTTIYLISPPTYSFLGFVFLFCFSLVMDLPVHHVLLCVMLKWNSHEIVLPYSVEAASYSVINYPELQEHPLYNCRVKFNHILNKNTIKTPH